MQSPIHTELYDRAVSDVSGMSRCLAACAMADTPDAHHLGHTQDPLCLHQDCSGGVSTEMADRNPAVLNPPGRLRGVWDQDVWDMPST